MKLIKRIIIIMQIITIILLITIPEQAEESKFFYMTATAYSRHPNCIAGKYNDGLTATMTPIREGVVAVNVDYIDGRWLIKSPLKLGDKIYIEGLGNYSVEDTGYFTDKDYKQDFWTVDIYMENYEDAINFGRQLRKVYVLNN